MNIENIYKQFLTSKLILFTIVFAFIAVRFFPISSQWNNLSFWGCLFIQIGIAFFLLQLNQTHSIIQGYTLLPALFYLLFIGINPVFYYDIKGSIAALCFVLCCYFLFDSFQKPESQVNALNISLLLVLGSLLWTPLLFLFIILWIGFYHFQCFNVRVFFASLAGFIIVYLFIFTFSIFQGDKNIFLSLLPQIDTLFSFQKPHLTIFDWITCGFILLIYFIVGVNLFLSDISERVWTVSVLSYFYISSSILFLFFILQTGYQSSWGLICYIPITFLFTHFFSHSNKQGMHYLLLLFFILFIGIGVFQHISA